MRVDPTQPDRSVKPKVAPKLPAGMGGPVADAIRKGVQSGLKPKPKVSADRVERMAKPSARPSVGRPAPEQKPGVPYNYGKDAVERGSNTKGGGKPAAKSGPYNTSPDRMDKSGKGSVPNAGKNPDRMGPKGPGKPDAVPGPGNRPSKPAPTPTVYRAKKGDGLWQVAEKTKPAGVSTAAWWTKIKKLNSSNGKVNRTYTGTGVKLPKS
jgi:hypothetical protein